MPDSFSLSASRQGSVTVLALTGRLDLDGSREFDRQIKAMLERKDDRIVFDCAGLTHIASLGLRSLLAAVNNSGKSGGRIVFCAAPANVAQIFTIAGFEKLFTTYPDTATAVASFD